MITRVKNMSKEEIYFHQPNKAKINTSKVFTITREGDRLRVKNKNVNCLFSNLTIETFHDIYNQFVSHLNLNFSPLKIDGKIYQLEKEEQDALEQKIITNWIYFYTINNLEVKVRCKDFTHPYMVDYTLALLDKKYGVDTEASLKMGATILRRDFGEYRNSVKARRRYYDR